MQLRELQQNQGAILSGETGFPVTHFGNPSGEYTRATEHAALFDLGQRTLIELTGEDRAKFLHNFCTNDIKKLEPGQSCEAFATNVKARVLGHLFAFADEESILVESVASARETLLPHLDRYIIMDDVELHDRTDSNAEFYLSGPESLAILKTAGMDVPGLEVHRHTVINGVRVCRLDWLGASGFLLIVPVDNAAELWEKLTTAGATPAGSDAFHPLRVIAGLPLYGTDVTEDQLAPEAGRTSLAISYTKGCYLGQEPIARIDALGHVNKHLRGVRILQECEPATGSVFQDDAGTEIGRLTSFAQVPGITETVALGYLKATHAKPGTRIQVQTAGGTVQGEVFWSH